MDPLSVTSGIVGIVAFTLQLAKTASKVKTAVEEIKSAPKEASDLIERLAMLETACELIGFHLQRRETLQDHPSPASLTIISKALAQCLARVQGLEQILSALSSSDALPRTPRPKFDTISRLRLVLCKDKISSLVQEIDRVISLLQFVIQVDMWTMTTRPIQALTLSSNSTQHMNESSEPQRSPSTTLPAFTASPPAVARNIRQATSRHCRSFRYLGYITWTIADDCTGDDDDNVNRFAHRKGSISFKLPFTSTQLRMHYFGGMGTPSYALNVTHVIEERSELGRRLRSLMSSEDGTGVLNRLISERELSLYSIVKHQDREMNLFFMAVSARWAEGCKYLLQHDVRHQFREDETPPFMFGRMPRVSGKPCQVIETMLSVRPLDMQEKDFRYLLQTESHPDYFSQYLKVFLKSPAVDHDALLSYAWVRLVLSFSMLWKSFLLADTSNWTPAFQYLLEQGVDIHRKLGNRRSAYTQLLVATMHPFQADEVAYRWLKILKACGVDISRYAEIESSLIEKAGLGNYADEKKRKMVILDFEGLPMPSWRWELPTGSNIIEVLEEFLNLGYQGMEYRLLHLNPTSREDFKYWKAENHYRWWGHKCFPFLLAPIDCIEGTTDYRLAELWCRETYTRAVEIRDKRFARRQAKKWRKSHPGEKPPSSKMPGTWID